MSKKLNIDGFYEIGKSHAICQDYVFTEKLSDNFCYGILCDGCSGSPFTDLGARILVHHAKKAIKTQFLVDPNFSEYLAFAYSYLSEKIIINEAILSAERMDLPRQCLDASIWIIIVLKKDKETVYSVFGWGDGVLIVKETEKTTIRSVNYLPSQIGEGPYYLNYYSDSARTSAYLKRFPDELEIENIVVEKDKINTTKEKCPYCTPTVLKISSCDSSPIHSVSISSDGLKTFNHKESENPLVWASKRYIDYQSFEGVFVERRMKALSRRDMKDGISHYDDISMVSVIELPE